MVATRRMHAGTIRNYLTLTSKIRNSLSLAAADAAMSAEADTCCDIVHSAVARE
jgi:hypothetical protein